jgi:hypothetical protein
MKNLFIVLIFLTISTFSYSQKRNNSTTLILPNTEAQSRVFYGTNDFSIVSFEYAKVEKDPAILQAFVINLKTLEIVHYVGMEFYREGRILFTIYGEKDVPYIVSFNYGIDPDYNVKHNSLFLRNLKIK